MFRNSVCGHSSSVLTFSCVDIEAFISAKGNYLNSLTNYTYHYIKASALFCLKMPNNRQKNFYAVTHGKEIGIYTSWTQAGDSVIGFAKAKFKGFCTYSEAAACMSASGYSDFNVYDGETTFSKATYEQGRVQQSCTSNTNIMENDAAGNVCENESTTVQIDISEEHQNKIPRVYIDGSCIQNGASSATAGYGLFWGDQHPWNCCQPLPQDSSATNNRAELAAAIKAVQIARENNLEQMVVYSDSKYVIQGVTEWIYKWKENGWKTAGGDDVKNKGIWLELSKLVDESTTKISWKHVAAHTGIPGNEEADRLANRAAKGAIQSVSVDHEKGSNHACNTSSLHTNVVTITKSTDKTNRNESKNVTVELNVTPQKNVTKDHTNTPVPGSINGSCVSGSSPINVGKNKKNLKNNQIDSSDMYANSQMDQVMKNMQTVLESVLFELHQSKEEHSKFKQDVNGKLCELSQQQQTLAQSLVTISKDLPIELRKGLTMINENLNTCKSATAAPKVENTKSIGELKDGINTLQNSVTILDALKSSVLRMETTCTDLRCDATTRNTAHDSQISEIRNFSHQILETVRDVRNENRRMRDNIAEMEKGLSALSESEEYKLFSKPRKDNKEKETGCDQTLSKTEIIVSDTEDEDTEITFNKKRSSATDVGESSATTESITNQDTEGTSRSDCSKEQEQTSQDNKSKSPKIGFKTVDKALANRKHKVCVIGDSIVGQLNIPLLGKGTHTYVQRLKAPKLQDISKHEAETKDASIIIIHSGINNLRDNEQTEACVEIMTNTITSLKLAASNSKVLVSCR